jgi:hypothetical protein
MASAQIEIEIGEIHDRHGDWFMAARRAAAIKAIPLSPGCAPTAASLKVRYQVLMQSTCA